MIWLYKFIGAVLVKAGIEVHCDCIVWTKFIGIMWLSAIHPAVLFQARMERRRRHVKTASQRHWTPARMANYRTTNSSLVLPPCCSREQRRLRCSGMPCKTGGCGWLVEASRGRHQCRLSRTSCNSSSSRVRYLCFRQTGQTRLRSLYSRGRTTVS